MRSVRVPTMSLADLLHTEGPPVPQRPGRTSRRLPLIVTPLVVLGLLAACSPPEPPPTPAAHDGTNDVAPALTSWDRTAGPEGADLEFDGVTVGVPQGAVPDGERIHVRFGLPLGTFDGPFAVEQFGAPIEVEHDSPLLQPLTLTWDVSQVPAEQLEVVALARWDEEAGAWAVQPVPARYDGTHLTAEIQDFSIWTWFSTTAADISQLGGQVFGGRAGAPTCSGTLPDWVDGTVRPDEDMSAAPLRVCFEERSGSVLAKIVNNRPYAQIVTFDGDIEPGVIIPTSPKDLAPLGLSFLVGERQVVVPPTSELEVLIPRPSVAGSFIVTGTSEVNALTVMADVLGMALASVPLDAFDNPAANVAVQLIFECGGPQIADAALAGGFDEGVVGSVIDVTIGCASELMRPGSELGLRFERLVRERMVAGGHDAAYALKAHRAAHVLTSKAAALQYLQVMQYVAELLAESQLDASVLSVRGRGAPPELGRWQPTCTDPAADSDRLYRNLALQDSFADTDHELWQFPDWRSASKSAVAPLRACSPEHRAALAALLPDDWADATAARILADVIRALDGLPGTTANYGIGMASLPDGATWLSAVPSEAGENSGRGVDVAIQRIDQTLTFPSSTSQWIGCQGSVAETTYQLDGQYTTLSLAFGLLVHTPEGLTVHLEIGVDGASKPLLRESVTVGTVLERQELDVTGASTLTVRASTDDQCTISSTAYGAFLDTWLR